MENKSKFFALVVAVFIVGSVLTYLVLYIIAKVWPDCRLAQKNEVRRIWMKINIFWFSLATFMLLRSLKTNIYPFI